MKRAGDYQPTNPTRLPVFPDSKALSSSFAEALFEMGEEVSLILHFPEEDSLPVVAHSDRSSVILELLWQAAKRKAVVHSLRIDGKPVTAGSAARLTWFCCKPGFGKPDTFRGWRRQNLEMQWGNVIWRAAPAWRQLKEIIPLLTITRKTGVSK